MPFAISLPESHFISGKWTRTHFVHAHTRTHAHICVFCIGRWRLTATGIMGDRMQMHRCTHPQPRKTQTHTAGRLSQLTCRLCVHGSVAGQIVLAQWQIGLKPSGSTSTRSLSLFLFSWPISGSLCASLSASGFVVFLSPLKFSMQCPQMGSGWVGSHSQDSHVIPLWDKRLPKLTKKSTSPPQALSFVS